MERFSETVIQNTRKYRISIVYRILTGRKSSPGALECGSLPPLLCGSGPPRPKACYMYMEQREPESPRISTGFACMVYEYADVSVMGRPCL